MRRRRKKTEEKSFQIEGTPTNVARLRKVVWSKCGPSTPYAEAPYKIAREVIEEFTEVDIHGDVLAHGVYDAISEARIRGLTTLLEIEKVLQHRLFYVVH